MKLKPQVVLLGLAALLSDTASELTYPLLPVFLTTTLEATPAVIGLIELAVVMVAMTRREGTAARPSGR